MLRFIHHVIGQRRLDVVAEIFSRDCVDHQAGGVVRGVEGVLRSVGRLLRAFADVTVCVNAIAAEAPLAAAWLTLSGTGRQSVDCVLVFRIEGGRLVERWELLDAPSLREGARYRDHWTPFATGERALLRVRC